MKRFLALFCTLIMVVGLFCGCDGEEVDRSKELQSAMKANDKELSATFLENASSFDEVSEYLKTWAEKAGLEIAAEKDHYIIIRNPATAGYEDADPTTLQCHVDPLHLRKDLDLLSMSMACLLGPMQHGKILLMVTENDEEDLFTGAQTLKKKNITDRHIIHLEMAGSAMVYTSGAYGMSSNLTCKAPRREPEYTRAYTIDFSIPRHADPYAFDKANNYPNPIETIGNLLASAKSSGRLFEIASFESESESGFLPHRATAVVVIDENNVENFQKRFDTSFETIEKRFSNIEKERDDKQSTSQDGDDEPLFKFTMTETDLPRTVLKQKGSDNIISLMYTLQTGIVGQNEESGELESLAYIKRISTKNGRFDLNVRMRADTEAALTELSNTYLITSGLCDVVYDPGKAVRLWSAREDGPLADFFYRAVDLEKEQAPINLGRTECDVLGRRGKNLDLVFYRVNSDHRNAAIKNILAYLSGEDVPE